MSQQEVWKKKVDLFRKRFSSRDDVFSVKWYKEITQADPITGEIKATKTSGIAPQCENFWKESLCLIRENRGGCTGCPNKKYAQLTDDWVWKHISGEKELVFFLLQEKGLRFGAIDFDDENLAFSDAKLCKDYSVNVLNLPCYIARSSKKGYHLYWFFSDFVPAHFFTSMARWLFKKTGIIERSLASPHLKLPEVFPKQSSFQDSKIGNGIKLPMIEPRMKDGFNCWVDDGAVPILVSNQWDYFRDCVDVTPEQLNEALKKDGVEIIERPVSRSASTTQRHLDEKPGAPGTNSQPRTRRGDFQKVINGCPALKQFWEKNAAGQYKFDVEIDKSGKGAPHVARLSSMLLALGTENGDEMILDRWPGDKTKSYLEQAKGQDYSPTTCRWLQENGVCKIGLHPKNHDHCLKKNPPSIVVNGERITNPDDLPEIHWPEPSPVRFATMREGLTAPEIIHRLNELFAGTEKDKNRPKGEGAPEPAVLLPDWEDHFYNLMREAKYLKADEYKRVQDHVRQNKWMPSKEIKEVDKKISKDMKDEKIAEKKQTTRHFHWQDVDYFMEDSRYLVVSTNSKGEKREKELTNFVVEVREEIVQYDSIDDSKTESERTIQQRIFLGSIKVNGRHHPFRTIGEQWQKGADTFFSFLIQQAGGDLKYKRADYDDIRIAINGFSEQTKVIRNKISDIGHFSINHQDCYLMPSVIVTKDEVRTNSEYEISFRDDLCKNLDFKVIEGDEFKKLALHIITDFFGCNSSLATMTAFAHAMSAAMISHMPLKKGPVLWIGGNFSGGKSFIGEAAQCFFGEFTSAIGTGGSGKSKIGAADFFRHSLLMIDDFKETLENWGSKDMLAFIQTAYDRSGRTALNRDGTLRERMARVRGNILVTGEDVPLQEASAISRMLIVEMKGSKDLDKERGQKVIEMKKDYSGFTPHFIQFVYSMDKAMILQIYRDYHEALETPIRGKYQVEGATRIAENLASNMLAFRLAMEMLVSKGVILEEQRDNYCRTHFKNLEIIRTTVCNFVGSQKGAEVFLDSLCSLFQNPARFHIQGWPGFNENDHKNSIRLGFWRETTPEYIYIFPKEACKAANQLLRENRNQLQSMHHISRQLVADGHIPAGMWDGSDGNNNSKQVVGPDGVRSRCWVIKRESIGFVAKEEKKDEVKTDLNVLPDFGNNQAQA